MNSVHRYAFAKKGNGNSTTIAVPPSPSASATKMASRLRSERQTHGNNSALRGAVTPAAIRASMPPVRDLEFEYLKKFQTDLYRVIVRRKAEGCFHAGFTVTSRDLDDYTLDFIFNKLVAVLRHEKFFVSLGSSMPRSFVVSWDPILTKDSITQEEWNDPNSVASVRTRRFLRMQRKHETIANDEQETARQFQHYLQVMNEDKTTPPVAPIEYETLAANQSFAHDGSAYQPLINQRGSPEQSSGGGQQHQLQIDSDAKARSMLMSDLLNMARFEQPALIQIPDAANDDVAIGNDEDSQQDESMFAQRSLRSNQTTAETLKMMQAADQIAGAFADAPGQNIGVDKNDSFEVCLEDDDNTDVERFENAFVEDNDNAPLDEQENRAQ